MKEFEASNDDLKIFSDEMGSDGMSKKLFIDSDAELNQIKNNMKAFNKKIGQEAIYVRCVGCDQIFNVEECHIIALGHVDIDHLVLDEESNSIWRSLTPIRN